MTIHERAEKAAMMKGSGRYNCAQAVSAVLADQTELSEEQLSHITAGFCAGMGTMEATCGALIGAGIVAGLSTGGSGTLPIAGQMLREFKTLCGAVTCKDLKSRVNGRPLCPCEDCVRNAVLAYGKANGLD